VWDHVLIYLFFSPQVMAPRLLESVFAAVGDLYLYRLSNLIFNGQVARWTVSLNSNPYACIFFVMHRQLQLLDLNDPVQLFCQLVNWFMFFCITRTLSNSLETVACAIRPTSAITWIYVGLLDFIHIKSKCRYVFLEVVPVG
jgi:GPI mannosyltransferase 3